MEGGSEGVIVLKCCRSKGPKARYMDTALFLRHTAPLFAPCTVPLTVSEIAARTRPLSSFKTELIGIPLGADIDSFNDLGVIPRSNSNPAGSSQENLMLK